MMWQGSTLGPEPPMPGPGRAREAPEHAARPPGLPSSPFKYLDYFEESEHDCFAGRGDEVREALVGLTRGRTYVLYGGGGLGKTSLLLAGLFPGLRQRGFRPIRVRLLDSPGADFCAALAAELERPELAGPLGDDERLALVTRVLAEHSAREPLVIALDQFEEFFVRFKDRPEEQARFISLLGRIWREHAANVRLVFVMREDYYAPLADLRAELPDLTVHGLRLLPLTAYGTRQAIVRPLQHAGISYEEAFVNRLVDLLALWRFEPAVLQIVCTELYRNVVALRGAPVHLTREDLERLGGVEGVLRGYVQRVTSGLVAERLLLIRVVLDVLISSETRTRRAVRAEDLLSVPVRASLTELREVLGHLSTLRLVRVESRQGERWYELLHEQLVPIIEGWLTTDLDYVRFRHARKFVSSLTQDTPWREDSDWLLSAAQLAEGVEPWRDRLRLEPQQVEFLLRSAIQARAPSTSYWVERFDEFGAGRSTKLLLGLIEHPSPKTRQAALAACGQVHDETGQLAARCLHVALSDPVYALRRMAGGSFARLAGPRELQALRRAIEQQGPRELIVEVLADLREAGKRIEGIPRPWRLRARVCVRQRSVERYQRSIRRLVGVGVRTALLATLLWCLTSGLVHVAYRFLTIIPEWVTQSSPWGFTLVLLGVALLLTVFVFMPTGALVAWRVSRKACIERLVRGRQEWSRSVLRSKTLMLASVLVSTVLGYVLVWFGGARWWQITSPPVLLGTPALAWLMTSGLVWLGSRCIPPGTRAIKVYLWALLCSFSLPAVIELAAGGVVLSGKAGASAQVLMSMMGIADMLASFLAMVLTCALEQSQEWPRSPSHVPRHSTVRRARALVVLATVAIIPILALFVGFDTFPFGGSRELRGELALRGSVFHVRDADYAELHVPRQGLFALSVRDEGSAGTYLVVDGDKLANGSLLVSARSDLSAAVIAEPVNAKPGPPHGASPMESDYNYRLREEPIFQGLPEKLSTDHWTLITLPLFPLGMHEDGAPSKWQAWLQGGVPEPRREITGVQLHPVMLQIAEQPAQSCMAILGSSFIDPADVRSSIVRNRAETAVVPPPNSREDLLRLEDFRIDFHDEERWSFVMTLLPFQEYIPPECQEVSGPQSLLGRNEAAPGVQGQVPMLTVAVKLY